MNFFAKLSRCVNTANLYHSSDIRNTSISQRCSKRSIFKYFKKIIIKIQRFENWSLYKVFLSIFFKSPKIRKIRVCLNRIESMSLLWFVCPWQCLLTNACPYSRIIWFVDVFIKLMLKVYEEILGDKVEKGQISNYIVDSPCVLVMGK